MSKEEIIRIREKIELAQTASIKLQTLLIKREELESNISLLASNNAKEQLKHLKSKKIELDHLIDRVEAEADHPIELLQQQLLESLFSLYPEQSFTLKKMKQEKAHHLEELQQIQDFKKLLVTIKDHLEEIIAIRQRIQRLGLLSYIFGASPNVMIAQNLESIHKLIPQAISYPLLKKLDLYIESLQTLENLSSECLTRWNYRKIDTCFTEYKNKIETLISNWQSEEARKKETIESLTKQIDQWVEQIIFEDQ